MSDAPTSPTRIRDEHALGVALMMSGVAVVPVIDLIAKGLGQGFIGADPASPIISFGAALPALQISWGRFLVQAVLMAALLLMIAPRSSWAPRRFGLVALRGVLLALATVFFFTALRYLSMAEAISIFFVEPLILTLLSVAFLGERIGWRRIAAIAVGFAGALLIIRPNFVAVGWPALLPLGTAFCFALYLMLTRKLADQSQLVLQFWSGLVGLGFVSLVLSFAVALDLPGVAPIALSDRHWAALGVLGAVAAACHFLIAIAFRYAEASALAPLQYFEIVAAALLGYFAFGEVLDEITLVGLCLIVGSGVFVLRREKALVAQRDAAGVAHPIAPPRRE